MAALRLQGCWPGTLSGPARQVRDWQVWALREPLRGFVLAVTVLAAAVAGLAAALTRWRPSQLAVFVALLVCGVALIESTRTVREVHGSIVRDLQPVWYLAIAVTLPPAYAFLAPLPLLVYKLCRTPGMVLYRRVFSNATISLGYGSAAVVFHAVPSSAAGPAPGAGAHVLAWAAVAVGCGLVGWVINDGLIVVAIKLADPASRVRELVGNRATLTADLVELSLGVSLALFVAINPWLIALALPSVLLYRRFMMRAQLVAGARIDPGTGLLNAGAWRREAEVELARAQRHQGSAAVVIVRIDHFASVAETAGRPAADQVLRRMACILREHLRGYDLIGRHAGERFAVLLPETGLEEARRVSERLRDELAAEPVAIEDGSHAGFVFRMTVSIGVASMDEARSTLAGLIEAADAALAGAARAGAVVCAAPAEAIPAEAAPADAAGAR
jgi:diguanylate cyclase (GGDEF)-like protein